MSILKEPDFEDLFFRQKLLSDEATMQYNHAYGGTIPFPREQWKNWYQRWIDCQSPYYFYRYIVDEDTNEYVGEAAYRKETESGRYVCSIIIMARYRNKGYGRKALTALCTAAKNNKVEYLYDDIAIDNPSLSLFQRLGFEIILQNDEFTRVRIKL